MKRSEVREGTQFIIAGIIMFFVVALVLWGGWRLYVVAYRDVAPRQQEAEREVYVNTPSYILGKQQIISKYEAEYHRAKDKQSRRAIANEALNEASTVEESRLSPQVRSFLAEARSGQ